ncbi:MAG: hypothetical protein KDA58_06610 [Planctomycetaceae bacterium]|nr:hypothetical protein [Planctomycetaceae bacterium]
MRAAFRLPRFTQAYVLLLAPLFFMYTGDVSARSNASRPQLDEVTSTDVEFGSDRTAEELPEDLDSVKPRRQRRSTEFRREEFSEEVAAAKNTPKTYETDCGLVFLGGRFLSAPYILESSGKTVLINGNEIPGRILERNEQVRFWELCDYLDAGDILWVTDETSTVFANGSGRAELLMMLSSKKGDGKSFGDSFEDLLTYVPDYINRESFERDWNAIHMSPELSQAIEQQVAELEALETSFASLHAGATILNHAAYPLTVLGMLLCVLAFGHLLAYPPFGFNALSITSDSPIALQAVVRSLAFIAVLSCLDLLWTMLASGAGQMRELNPLGSQVIGDPNQLIAFKFAATGMGVALLFTIRKNQSAQVASWWMCLVLVLLSMRWIAFNSLFVA